MLLYIMLNNVFRKKLGGVNLYTVVWWYSHLASVLVFINSIDIYYYF